MQVCIADIDSISKNPDYFVALLSPRDQKRVSQYKKQTRKLQFILGHLMADASGKKYTSVAHRDNLVVVASADNTPVGIDIENMSVKRDFIGAAELMGLPEPKSAKDFYKSFTKYEAIYKLGMDSKCTDFIEYGDYLICVTATREFQTPRLRKFVVNSLLPAE